MENENKKYPEFINWILKDHPGLVVTDVTPLIVPGVFRLECVSEKRAYFGDSISIYSETGRIINTLLDGTSENQELVQDFQKFGFDNFCFSIVVSGSKYYDQEKRKAALDAAKAAWEGELY